MKPMTYPSDKKFDPWYTEPDIWEMVELDEPENEKVYKELSLENLADDELSLDESEFDL